MNWRGVFLVISCGAELAACVGNPREIPPAIASVEVQRVEIPVPVKCQPEIGAGPMYVAESEFRAVPDIFEAIKLYKRDRLLRIGREGELLAALKECEL
jgi:hypothetical protein